MIVSIVAIASQSARKPVLERPQRPAPPELQNADRTFLADGKADDALLAAAGPREGRRQHALVGDKLQEFLRRRLYQAVHDHLVEALAGFMIVVAVAPQDRHIGEAEGLEPD